MTRYWATAVVAIVALVSFLLGAVIGGQSGPARAASGPVLLYYHCPMHPTYKSDKAGDAPCCGMRLEPVYAPGLNRSEATAPETFAIHVGEDHRQLMGITTAEVTKSKATIHRRFSGRVAADGTRTWRLNASTDCWIRQMHAPTTGTLVKKDERLLDFYTTSFLSAANAFQYALSTLARHKDAESATGDQSAIVETQVRQAIESLQTLGVSDYQIEHMRRTRTIDRLVELRSPVQGLVLNRGVSAGQFINAGTELYRIVDLSRVWIVADVFGDDAARIRPGQLAHLKTLAPAATLAARVSSALPQLDPETRTLKVRLEVDNPTYMLRPDMFVDVEFDLEVASALFVPAAAVLDSGLRKTVFVERHAGRFEPVQVGTGTRAGQLVEIRHGLQEGDSVVTSGTFLLDSENRMRSADAARKETKAKGLQTDPVCGMSVDPKTSQWKVESQGKTVWFCSEHCLRKYKSHS